MYSLTFLSAQQLAKDEEATCTMLESMPQITYNILFKVAFRENKIKLLCELVKMWPYSQLKFQALLQICWSCSLTSPKKCPECQETLKNNESSKNKIDAIIFGVISSIRKAIMDDSQQLPNRRLQQLDMTGLVNQNIWWNLTIMRLWASSISRAQLYIFSQHDLQSQTRDQEAKASPLTTFPREMCVELLVDLQVSSSSKKFLKEAFSANANSPLHLKCQDLYTTDIIDHDFGQLLSLLDPLTIRRVDLNYGKIILNDVGWFLSQITTFQNLQSLKLPSFSEREIQKMNSTPKTLVDILAAELSKLKHLREISVHSLCLSDKVEDLLRDLPCSLESLQLSFCSLTMKDLIYLARSQHSTHLIKLDLSGNKLTDQLDAFLKLLKSASNSLKWLNVTKCGIKDSDFHKTLSYLYSCIRLSHLGLHANPLSSSILLDFLKSCQHKLPNMKIISVPIFLDCYRDDSQHDCFPRLLKSRLDTNKLGSVLREMKQMQITRGESAIEVITSFVFEVGDYFDLQ